MPTTSITVVNMNDTSYSHKKLKPSQDLQQQGESYLISAVWRSSNLFTPTWKNRVGNESLAEDCQAPSFVCTHKTVQGQKSETGWIGNYQPHYIFPLPDENEYLTVAERNGFPHVQLVNTQTNQAVWKT